jgi:GNAT superfamily N-acetyltransferase
VPDIQLIHYGFDQFSAIRPTLIQLYAEIYAHEIETDPFFSVAEFEDRLKGQASRPGWEAVVAYDGSQAAGYAYGQPLREGAVWWKSMLESLPEADTWEDGKRTLALFEIMVRTPWRGTGLAHRIHEELLSGRDEQRVTLLVEREHPKVKTLYEAWGYRDMGDQLPSPDAPVYATMLRAIR